ncbi:hypothetical protein ACFOD4_19095 [Pseudoroseomonas globiformis]|uniref:Copper-binding protein n=1 Tax=Teichococcus globiformis TaxID=2307229 RepID=A0ABV7G6L9_9PROT
MMAYPMMAGRALGMAMVVSCLTGASTAMLAQTMPAPIGAVRGESVTAVVESVDLRARQVLLRLPDDHLATAQVGPEIRNLAQVKAGDTLQVDYREAVAIAMASPGDGRPPVSGGAAASRAEPGERPAGAAGDAIRVRVRIDNVDAAGRTVTFTGPRGMQRRVAVRNERVWDFARSLSPGDQVDISYAEALVVSVQPRRP